VTERVTGADLEKADALARRVLGVGSLPDGWVFDGSLSGPCEVIRFLVAEVRRLRGLIVDAVDRIEAASLDGGVVLDDLEAEAEAAREEGGAR